jgi:hypothetical protein
MSYQTPTATKGSHIALIASIILLLILFILTMEQGDGRELSVGRHP